MLAVKRVGKKVFISYSHTQEHWVVDRLVPCLRAGGAQILIDRELFEAGHRVTGQMDARQEGAELSLLLLSPEYLKSEYCLHEMTRAIDQHSKSPDGKIVPVIRTDCELPENLRSLELLHVDLRNDKNAAQWDSLLNACAADLG